MAEDLEILRSEIELVGQMLSEPDVAIREAADIRVDDIFCADARKTIKAIYALAVRGEEVNEMSVVDELQRSGAYSVGDAEKIAEWRNSVVSQSTISYNVRTIIGRSARRQLKAAMAHHAANGLELATDEDLQALKTQIAQTIDRPLGRRHGVETLTVDDLMANPPAKPEMILDPILAVGDLAMAHGSRGIGKSWFGFALAVAIASGRGLDGKPLQVFGRWTVPKPRRVLLIDGEMSLHDARERVLRNIAALGCLPPENLFLANLEAQRGHTIPSLADRKGQAAIDRAIERHRAEVVIIDNLSSLVRGVVENDAQDWDPYLEWLGRLRSMGIAALQAHHDNKVGGQRGSSKKEDILSLVIHLSRPEDYDPEVGARFNVEITKSRRALGKTVSSFELSLDNGESGNPQWRYTDPRESKNSEIVEYYQSMVDAGTHPTVRSVAKMFECSKSLVSKVLRNSGIDPFRGKGGAC